MSVLVKIIGSNQDSDEYLAAMRLKKIIESTSHKQMGGEITIFCNATLIGQTVKDVDLIVIGCLSNCMPTLNFYDLENRLVRDKVQINNFCTTIEVKSHDITGVYRIGTDYFVKYGSKSHNVTEQSNMQKISAMNYFKHSLGLSPFITNLIWFTEVNNSDVVELNRFNGHALASNVLGSFFDFSDFLQLIVMQNKPYKIRNFFNWSSFSNGIRSESLISVINNFSKIKESIGNLTREKLEQITRKEISDELPEETNNKLLLYRGKAGTGKTIKLIQSAIRLVDEHDARVLMLTYNKALVSDMRRLFALAEIPDLFEFSCIHITTIHSYFYNLINKSVYENTLDGETFLQRYDNLLSDFNLFMSDEESIEIIRDCMLDNTSLNFEYVLLDEGQDVSSVEMEVITKLFPLKNIIVSDGGNQFVRNINLCDWSAIREVSRRRLKYCVRQKNNLIKFINVYFEHKNFGINKVLTKGILDGGKIIIVSNPNKFYGIYHSVMKDLKTSQNENYDMLILVPSSRVAKLNGEHKFKDTQEFNSNGIYFWDGTNEEIRENASIYLDEVRLVQYDSARGLEGWAVCCLDFDQFLKEKETLYRDEGQVNALILESREDRKNKYLNNWANIAMSRAIDTIILTIKDVNSGESRLLKKISLDYPDYVEWVE